MCVTWRPAKVVCVCVCVFVRACVTWRLCLHVCMTIPSRLLASSGGTPNHVPIGRENIGVFVLAERTLACSYWQRGHWRVPIGRENIGVFLLAERAYATVAGCYGCAYMLLSSCTRLYAKRAENELDLLRLLPRRPQHCTWGHARQILSLVIPFRPKPLYPTDPTLSLISSPPSPPSGEYVRTRTDSFHRSKGACTESTCKRRTSGE